MASTTFTNSLSTLLRRGLLALSLLCGSLIVTTSATAADAGASPKAVVETTVNDILSILRKPDFDLARDRESIKTKIIAAFDDTAMAQSVLSTAWRDATKEQQTEFKDLLVQTIEDTYLNRVQEYSNETVEFRGEEIRDNRATVETVVITQSANVPVNYKLRKRNDGRWLVYDVEVENVSMVSSYRDSYRDIVRRSGVDGLLEQMRAKAAPVPEV
ncbi:MAG TPA: ABC transporter substrate-binding protein [Pseudomonadales bacterium]